jgi:hypothetical protein
VPFFGLRQLIESGRFFSEPSSHGTIEDWSKYRPFLNRELILQGVSNRMSAPIA